MPSSDDATRKLRSGSREPVLRIEGLCTYLPVKHGILRRTTGHVRAVDGVDLRVLGGQTLAVVGEAGAGKTALARSITRRLPATSGKVLFEGKDLLGMSGSRYRAVARQICSVSADALAVPEPLAVLRALLQGGPKLVIFDEAFSGLTAVLRLGLFEELRRQQDERGLSCLLLTRDARLSSSLADEIAVLHAGQIIETGGTASVLSQPQHPHTQALLAAEARSAAAPEPVSGRPESLVGCRFRARCPHAFLRCAEAEPALFAVPGGLSRCFLHDPAAAR